MKQLAFVALAVLVALITARPAGATRALPVSLEQLSRIAEVVVDGEALAARSYWLDGRIFTRLDVKVLGTWKGALRERTISVVVRGGVVEGIGQRVDGEAVITPGDHTVLFLRYDEELAGYRPIALEQGAYRVRELDDARPARLVRRDLAAFEQQVRELTRAP
jgi:hypothetical protein